MFKKLIILFLCVFNCAFAQLRVGVYENYPLLFKDETGEVQGYLADVFDQTASKLGIQHVYVYGRFGDLLKKTMDGELDIMLCVAHSDERAKHLYFPKENFFSSRPVIYRRPDVEIDSVLALNGKRIVALEGDIHLQVIKHDMAEMGISAKFIEVDTYEDVLITLDKGECEAGLVTRLVAVNLDDKYNAVSTNIIFNPIKLFFVAPINNLRSQIFLNEIDAVVARWKNDKDSPLFRMHNKWFAQKKDAKGDRWLKWVFVGSLTFAVFLLVVLVLKLKIRAKTKVLENALSEKNDMEKKLVASEEQKKMILNTISEAVFFINKDYETLWMNSEAEKIIDQNHLCQYRCMLTGKDEKCSDCPIELALKNGYSLTLEHEWNDGTVKRVTTNPIYEDRVITGAVITIEDITLTKKVEDINLLNLEFSQSINRCLSKDELFRRVVHIIERCFGKVRLYIVSLSERRVRDDFSYISDGLETSLPDPRQLPVKSFSAPISVYKEEAQEIPPILPKECLCLISLKLTGTYCAMLELYENKVSFGRQEESLMLTLAAQARAAIDHFETLAIITHQANFDPLTNLPNRTSFISKLKETIKFKSSEGHYALIIFDINKFKVINDNHGHIAGDHLLKKIAARLKKSLPNDIIISRLISDEFALLMPYGEEEDVYTIIGDIKKRINQEVNMFEVTVKLTISSGVVFKVEDYEKSVEIMKDCDMALVEAKKQGHDSLVVFDDNVKQRNENAYKIEVLLNHIDYDQEFSLVFQPIVSLSAEKLGFEALLRWNSSELGIIAPSTFIPLAEAGGCIVNVDRWVINNACRQLKECLQSMPANIAESVFVSVNISAKHLSYQGLVDYVEEILATHDLQAKQLALEVTEYSFMDDGALVISNINKLVSKGIKISLDDFGTGFSCLSLLSSLPVDCLKADRSFICDIEMNESNRVIISAIIALADKLNIRVVCEGVERAEEVEVLKGMGCSVFQGNFFCKPLLPENVAEYAQSYFCKD